MGVAEHSGVVGLDAYEFIQTHLLREESYLGRDHIGDAGACWSVRRLGFDSVAGVGCGQAPRLVRQRQGGASHTAAISGASPGCHTGKRRRPAATIRR